MLLLLLLHMSAMTPWQVEDIRENKEIANLKLQGLLSAVQDWSFMCMPFIVSFATLGTYALFDNVSHGPLSAKLIFVSLALFNVLRFSLSMLPAAIHFMVETAVSHTRVHEFLTLEEMDPNSVQREDQVDVADEHAGSPTLVEMRAVTTAWERGADKEPILKDISFGVQKGRLTCIVGRIGEWEHRSGAQPGGCGDWHPIDTRLAQAAGSRRSSPLCLERCTSWQEA
jgi:ATP-binding cassette, subfamily C (CFTR/MRP), member 1